MRMTWNSICLSHLHVAHIIYIFINDHVIFKTFLPFDMIDYMYACMGSINYINASTCSVYVVAYNMYTEIYVCYSETQNEKGTKWQKKGNTQSLPRQRNTQFSVAAGNLIVPGGVTARD